HVTKESPQHRDEAPLQGIRRGFREKDPLEEPLQPRTLWCLRAGHHFGGGSGGRGRRGAPAGPGEDTAKQRAYERQRRETHQDRAAPPCEDPKARLLDERRDLAWSEGVLVEGEAPQGRGIDTARGDDLVVPLFGRAAEGKRRPREEPPR